MGQIFMAFSEYLNFKKKEIETFDLGTIYVYKIL